jgi:hypothetical protein
LTQVLAEINIDPARPQTLSRRLKIDKSLAWKISRLITSAEPGIAVDHWPGAAAVEIFRAAAHKAGVGDKTLARATAAFGAIEKVSPTTRRRPHHA